MAFIVLLLKTPFIKFKVPSTKAKKVETLEDNLTIESWCLAGITRRPWHICNENLLIAI